VTFDEVKWVADKVKPHFVRFYGDFSGSKFFRNDSTMLIAVFTSSRNESASSSDYLK